MSVYFRILIICILYLIILFLVYKAEDGEGDLVPEEKGLKTMLLGRLGMMTVGALLTWRGYGLVLYSGDV